MHLELPTTSTFPVVLPSPALKEYQLAMGRLANLLRVNASLVAQDNYKASVPLVVQLLASLVNVPRILTA